MTQQPDEESVGRALVPFTAQPPASPLPTKGELGIILAIAQTAGQARGLVPVAIKTVNEAAAVMIAGHELGFGAMTSLRHMHVINGAVSPDGQAMAALVQAADPTAEFIVKKSDATVADIELCRANKQPLRIAYTFQDAERAGLTGKDVWKKYPADMLRWKAVNRLCRLGAPDLVNAVRPFTVRQAGAIAEAASDEIKIPELEPAEIEVAATATVNAGDDSEAVETEAEPPTERGDFDKWAAAQGLDTPTKLVKYLGLANEGEDPIGEQWVEPALSAGMTTDEALKLAQSALTDTIREYHKAHGSSKSPLKDALAAADPMGQLTRAIEARQAEPAEPETS